MLNETKRTKFVEAAVSYIGTPFVHQGRIPHLGLDCAGLIICAAIEAGYDINAPFVYGRRPRPQEMLNQLVKYCDITVDDGSPGLIHWQRPRTSLRPAHYSIRIDLETVVESVFGTGVQKNNYQPDLVESTWTLKD